MFSRVRNFLSRHRRKFIITGVVVGGTYLVLRYAQHKLVELQERQAREWFERTRRMQHFESTEKTCNQVIIGMSTELAQVILRECNTDELLEQLRQNPNNKIELWEEMKIVSFTRLATFIYASSMLFIAVRVQLNLVGGYIYKDVTSENRQIITDEIKQQYLSLIRYFLHDGGIRELVRLIKSKVTAIMKLMPLSQRFTLSDIEKLFWSLQMALNSDANDPTIRMSKFLLPSQVPEYDSSGPLLQKMFNETLDLLESDDASTICSNNICRGFSLAIDAIAESLGDTLIVNSNGKTNNVPNDNPSTSKDAELTSVDNRVSNINTTQIPLAKIIPVVSGITAAGYDSTTRPHNFITSLVTFYVVAEKAKVLGANVYETFSVS